MASQSGLLTEFTQFPQLPLELRYKVWDASMEGRIIEAVYDEDADFYYTEATKHIAFNVCQESRRQALRSHEVLKLKSIYGREKKNTVHFKTYINFKADTLYLSLAHLEGEKEMRGIDQVLPYQGANVYSFMTALSGLPTASSKLRHIAFEAESYLPDWVGIGLTGLSGLEQISIIYGDPCCGSDFGGHRKALSFLDVGPRNGHCAHLHKRTDELSRKMEDGIKLELERMNKDPRYLEEDPLIDERDTKKFVVVPKLLVREW
jgi:hypothetical protein